MAKIKVFGIGIDVPDSPKRKYKKRKRAKALSAPPKNKMVQEAPIKKGEPLP